MLLLSSVIFCCITCKQDATPVSPANYVYETTDFSYFKKADSLQFAKAYELSNKHYFDLLENSDLTLKDSFHVFSQVAYNHLFKANVSTARFYLDRLNALMLKKNKPSAKTKAIYHFLWGRHYNLVGEGAQAIQHLRKAARMYEDLEDSDYLRQAQTNYELSYAYRHHSLQLDSAYVFMDIAVQQFLKSADFYPHSLACEYLRADMKGIKRDFLTGIAILNNLIEYTETKEIPDSNFLFLCYNQRGKMLRKNDSHHKREAGLKSLKKALSIWKTCCLTDDARGQEVYRELLFYASYQADSLTFYKYWKELHVYFDESELTRINTRRILGNFYHDIKRYDSCLTIQKALLEEYKEANDVEKIAQTDYIITDCYFQLEQYNSAAYHIQKFILSNTIFKDKEPQLSYLSDPEVLNKGEHLISYNQLMKAWFYQYQKDTTQVAALNNAFKVSQLINQLIQLKFEQLKEEAIRNYLQDLELLYTGSIPIEIAAVLYEKTKNTLYLDWINRFIEQTKSILLYRDVVARQHDEAILPAAIQERVHRLEMQIKASRSAIMKGEKSNLSEQVSEQYFLNDSLNTAYPNYQSNNFFQSPPNLAILKKHLRKHNYAVLQYHTSATKDFLLFIHADTSMFFELATDRLTNQAIVNLQAQLHRGLDIDVQAYQSAAYQLYQTYIAPCTPFLKKEERLVIIPDQKLSFLPFEAFLYEASSGHFNQETPFLIKKYPIQYAYSLKNFWHKKDKKQDIDRNNHLLGLAFSKEGERLSDDFPLSALPNAPKELQAIDKYLLGCDKMLLYGDESTESYFIEAVSNQKFDLIHLALHAASSENNRYDNRIYFRADDGIDTLYGYELIPLSIETSLVVLSSCQTAYGMRVLGEGTYSLMRSFIQSGSDQVIASLWNIDDMYTAVLMDEFYQAWSKERDAMAALHYSKLKILQKTESFWSNPAFWSLYVGYE